MFKKLHLSINYLQVDAISLSILAFKSIYNLDFTSPKLFFTKNIQQ